MMEEFNSTSKAPRVSQGGAERRRLGPWDPPASRIVRASSGKDRHSKVVTAKGLRDRRLRLSVPTAIQFYDLQDRLGFDKPSEAIDWLLKASAAAIAHLPKLQTPIDGDHSNCSSEASKGSVDAELLHNPLACLGGGSNGNVPVGVGFTAVGENCDLNRGTLQSNVVAQLAQCGHHYHHHVHQHQHQHLLPNLGYGVQEGSGFPFFAGHGSGQYQFPGGSGDGYWYGSDLKEKGRG